MQQLTKAQSEKRHKEIAAANVTNVPTPAQWRRACHIN